MADKNDNIRTTITLPKELDDKIETLCKLTNNSKNGTIVNLLEVTIDGYINMWQMMKDPELMTKLVSAIDSIGDDKTIEAMNNLQSFVSSQNILDKAANIVIDTKFDEMKKK